MSKPPAVVSPLAVDSGPLASNVWAAVDPEKLTGGAIRRSSRMWSMELLVEWPRVIADHTMTGVHVTQLDGKCG
jgi:hypothetical protein